MTGAIIENMSTKKLFALGFLGLLFEVLTVLTGALIAPSPTNTIRYLATKCVDQQRARAWQEPWGGSQCQKIPNFDDALAKSLDANDIVFAVHVPVPGLEMSPWFLFLLVILQLDIAFKFVNQIEDDVLVTIDAGLAYRDDSVSEWTKMHHSLEQRPLRCLFSIPKTFENEGRFYDCDPVPLMELGSTVHKYYLLNVRLPVNDTVNVGIGEIKDVHVVGIHQNGGFTKVWISLKGVCGPWVLTATVWYWRRISLMMRRPVLLEKLALALGVSTTILNLPTECFSLGAEWTWTLLLEDVQQGFFYSALFCFWVIFCGEHLMDQSQRNRLSAYWWQVGLVAFGSSILLIFDLIERGRQLSNPFYSIWASAFGTKVAITCIIMAGISVFLYLLSLCLMVYHVLRNIGGKMQQLPAMPEARKQHYKGVIFRFRFLMLVTLACAVMTVMFFITTQVVEGHWRWGRHTLQLHSAFLTGIYGMWNLYVSSILFLYAPSHQHGRRRAGYGGGKDARGAVASQETQLTVCSQSERAPTEAYRMSGKVAQE